MKSKLLRHGHSSAVIIPAQFLRKLSLKKGDRVEMKFEYGSASIILGFPDSRQLRLPVGRALRKK